MRSITFILFFILFFEAKSQFSVTSDTIIDGKINEQILRENCKWFRDGYVGYRPKAKLLKKISKHIDQVKFVVVMGAWCSDSHMHIPIFFKVIDDAGISQSQFELIAVNREKKSDRVDISHLGIAHVPTFIVYKNGMEAGRIVENPNEGMEQDLLKILRK